jgi:uncharacterized membrane protein
MLAWKSLPGSAIQHSGMVRFQPTASGGTYLDIKKSYNPLVGGPGHSLATLLGADLKHLLDDDLVRFKSLIEEGKTRVHGEAVARDEVAAVPDTRATGPVPTGLTLAL